MKLKAATNLKGAFQTMIQIKFKVFNNITKMKRALIIGVKEC